MSYVSYAAVFVLGLALRHFEEVIRRGGIPDVEPGAVSLEMTEKGGGCQ